MAWRVLLLLLYFVKQNLGNEANALFSLAQKIVESSLANQRHLTFEVRRQALSLSREGLQLLNPKTEGLRMLHQLDFTINLLQMDFDTPQKLPLQSNLDEDKPIHILHLPKTGGTSLSSAAEYCPKGLINFHGHRDRLTDLPIDVDVFSVVRDPVDRFISSFIFYKQGGYRGFHRRPSHELALNDAEEVIQLQQTSVDIIRTKLKDISSEQIDMSVIIEDDGDQLKTWEHSLKQGLAETLSDLAKITWVNTGDVNLAYSIYLEAHELLLSLNGSPKSGLETQLLLLNQTLHHPIHRYETVQDFVRALKLGTDANAWKVLHCQENMLFIQDESKEACEFGKSRDPKDFHVTFRSQMYWLNETPNNFHHNVKLITFDELARCSFTEMPTLRSCFELPCDAALPHINGRARVKEAFTALSPKLRRWVRELYHEDEALFRCISSLGRAQIRSDGKNLCLIGTTDDPELTEERTDWV